LTYRKPDDLVLLPVHNEGVAIIKVDFDPPSRNPLSDSATKPPALLKLDFDAIADGHFRQAWRYLLGLSLDFEPATFAFSVFVRASELERRSPNVV
jgi:hypothetical protein